VSREREAELVRKARNGDGVALHDLITANLRFVVTVANEFRGSGCPMNELISDGNAGLAEAARRFDETRGLKFITYAAWWIRQSIRRPLSRRRRIVVAPSNRVADLRKVDSAREETSVTTIFESVEPPTDNETVEHEEDPGRTLPGFARQPGARDHPALLWVRPL
jgi:RNA polymerase sigma factor (sigma-70 family)